MSVGARRLEGGDEDDDEPDEHEDACRDLVRLVGTGALCGTGGT